MNNNKIYVFNRHNERTGNAKIKTLRLHSYTHAILVNGCRKNQPFEDLIKKMLAYKDKPVASWRADDWGLLDALNKMLTLRASSRHHALKNDAPPIRDAAFWARVDRELDFYYTAQYPGKELPDE